MNDMVKLMVDTMFADVAETDETRAMHDELMINCQEHFDDLRESGMSEEDALQAVSESLMGMQEVVDTYPRKAVGETAPAETEILSEEEAEEVQEAELIFPADALTRLRTDLAGHDVTVDLSGDDQVHVFCLTPEAIECRAEGEVLSVASTGLWDAPKAESFSWEKSLDKLAELNLKKIAAFFDRAIQRLNQQVVDPAPVRISLPKGLEMKLDVNTSAGDIDVTNPVGRDGSFRSASGDIHVVCNPFQQIDRLFASSASGDIQVENGSVDTLELTSISGDVEFTGSGKNARVKSVSGDIRFVGSSESLQASTVSGDTALQIDRMDEGEISAHSTSGSLRIILPSAEGVLAECSSVSGAIENDLPDSLTDPLIRVSAKTVSGEIYLGANM